MLLRLQMHRWLGLQQQTSMCGQQQIVRWHLHHWLRALLLVQLLWLLLLLLLLCWRLLSIAKVLFRQQLRRLLLLLCGGQH